MFVTENGRQGKALAVSFFRRCARLRSRAHDFHCSIEKRCGKLGRNDSFTEIHLLYHHLACQQLQDNIAQRETNYYITRCASELAWPYLALLEACQVN